MDYSTPGFPVHHQLPESAQTHVHRVSDAIQPSHPLPSPSPPALCWTVLLYTNVSDPGKVPRRYGPRKWAVALRTQQQPQQGATQSEILGHNRKQEESGASLNFLSPNMAWDPPDPSFPCSLLLQPGQIWVDKSGVGGLLPLEKRH